MSTEAEEVKVLLATANSGATLRIIHLDLDAFGAMAARFYRELQSTVKAERQQAKNALLRLMRAHRLMQAQENLLSISVGVDSNGRAKLVVLTERGMEERY